MKPLHRQFDELNNELIIRRKRLEAINEELKNSPVEVLSAEIVQLEREIEEANGVVEKCSPEIEALKAKIKVKYGQNHEYSYKIRF